MMPSRQCSPQLPAEAGQAPGFESADPLGPAAVRLRRIGVIDVGSNSIRLVVFDGMARSPAYFYNEKVLAGLGAGLSETGTLSHEGRKRAMAALRRFVALAERMGLSGLIAVATAAVREAKDGRAFVEQIETDLGLQVHVASGVEEARLAAQGVLLGWPWAEGVVCDMGGASMELARLEDGEIGETETSTLGPMQLAEIPDGPLRAKAVKKRIKSLRKSVRGPVRRLFLVGGSWRAVARLDMERVGYPLPVLHGYEPPISQLVDTAHWISRQSPEDMSKLTGISLARLSLIPFAAEVLVELIERFDPERVAVSAYGLREGLLYRQMPEAMRKRDPLMEACRHMEAAMARAPGFGSALFDWMMPIYAEVSAAELRLVRAACLLHDINWRGHPDYRAELCFESVARANICGIDHPSRIFLGLALMYRYKNASDALTGRYEALVPPDRAAEAQVLGRAMRLGAMLSGASVGVLDHAPLEVEENVLRLRLKGPARAFHGEAVERRLQALAQKMARAGEIVLE
jgi:exopolyphosphatase / guanosine-5'-triphosphate,3'-diphosphate pyrophosphatase